jgi:hypothetical protein
MTEPTLISVFLRKLLHSDSHVIHRLLEMSAVLALVWLAAIAKQKGPSEIGLVATLIITWGPIILIIQFMFLVITLLRSGVDDLDGIKRPGPQKGQDEDKR